MKSLARIEKKTIKYEITKTEPKKAELFAFENSTVYPVPETHELFNNVLHKFATDDSECHLYILCQGRHPTCGLVFSSKSLKQIKNKANGLIFNKNPIKILKYETSSIVAGTLDTTFVPVDIYRLLETWTAKRIR